MGGSVGEDGIPFVRVLRVQTMRHKMAGTCLMDIVCRSCRSMLLRARSVACVVRVRVCVACVRSRLGGAVWAEVKLSHKSTLVAWYRYLPVPGMDGGKCC